MTESKSITKALGSHQGNIKYLLFEEKLANPWSRVLGHLHHHTQLSTYWPCMQTRIQVNGKGTFRQIIHLLHTSGVSCRSSTIIDGLHTHNNIYFIFCFKNHTHFKLKSGAFLSHISCLYSLHRRCLEIIRKKERKKERDNKKEPGTPHSFFHPLLSSACYIGYCL